MLDLVSVVFCRPQEAVGRLAVSSTVPSGRRDAILSLRAWTPTSVRTVHEFLATITQEGNWHHCISAVEVWWRSMRVQTVQLPTGVGPTGKDGREGGHSNEERSILVDSRVFGWIRM